MADPRLSRRPIQLRREGDVYVVDATDGGLRVEVDGDVVTDKRWIPASALDHGVTLLLGERVALCWHRAEPTAGTLPSLGLVGSSRAMIQLRRQIVRVADLSIPVLLCGESGSGKELVARAIHQQGSRRNGVFRSINLGAVPESLAAAELFGAVKGAYSGADRSRPGFFRESDGGTLFLDEIGEASLEVQAMLLRVLESGEIQPVGSAGGIRVDVRVLAATDADLDAAVANERFKLPLLHRLQAFELVLPPLRERIDDLGRLFFHFLDEALASVDERRRPMSRDLFDTAYVPARLIARLARHAWPGNVRELRNVVLQAVIASQDMDTLRAEAWSDGPEKADELMTVSPDDFDRRSRPERSYRDPGGVTEAELRISLRSHDWNLRRAAEALRISRTSLYELIKRSPSIRTARDLTAGEIAAGQSRCAGDLVELARDLEVSVQGLKRRMKDFGMR